MASQTGADATKMQLKSAVGGFWAILGVPKGSQNGPKLDPKAMQNLEPLLVQFRVPFWVILGSPKGQK